MTKGKDRAGVRRGFVTGKGTQRERTSGTSTVQRTGAVGALFTRACGLFKARRWALLQRAEACLPRRDDFTRLKFHLENVSTLLTCFLYPRNL